MAVTKMPTVGTKLKENSMPRVSGKVQQGTQSASPAAVPKVTGDLSGEAWTRATPSQTKVPAKSNPLLTKTETVAVGGSRGGRTVYKEVEMPTLAGRAVKTVSGAMKQWGAGNLNALGTTQAVTGGVMRKNALETDKEQLQKELARYEYEAAQADTPEDRTYWEMEAQKARQSLAMREQGLKETKTAGQAMQRKADALSEAGAADIQQAKKGWGKVGSTLVDIGAAGLQMGADIGTGLLTGGGAMVPMAVRGFGGAAQEARQEGATLGQQLGYGLGSAAVSVATEKLSNVVKPFAKAFGAGISDNLVESAISKAVHRFAGTAAGKTALEAALKSGAGFLGEGTEEFLEDVANPILKRMTYDPNAKFDLEEAAYDFLIGGALGGLGGTVEGVTGAKGKYQGYQAEVQNAAIDNAYDTMREKGMFSQEARRAVRDAEDIMPKLDPGGHIAWGRMMQQVAPDRREEFQQAREIANSFGADLVVGDPGNGAAGQYQNNVITIDPRAENPVRQVLVHELTHHMETSGLYGDFSGKVLGFIAEDMGVDVENLKESIIREYGQQGVELDADGATRELVAKFAEDKLFRDERSIQRLLQTDRNLFQRIYDWIRDTVAKVRGTGEEQFLIDAQRLYEKALRQAGTQQGAGTAQNTFAGVNARTADLNALNNAQELERQGTDADAIRRQTGWFRGMDGKWRFEIDDSGMRYDRRGFTENPDMVRRRELENKLLYGDMSQAEMDELRSLTAATRGVVKPSKLGDYIQHDALFEAYPELKNVNVRFENLEMGQNAYFDPKSNTVVMNTFLWDQPEDVIVHEVQHAIQQAEGFTGGANPEYWEANRPEGSIRRAEELYRNTAGEIEARDAAARRQLTPEQRELKMPTLGDENTVFADRAGAAMDYIPGVIGEDAVLQGIQTVAGMEPVAAVQGTEFAKGEVDLVTQVTNYFDSLGNMVFNPQLGDVKLSRSGAKSDIAHGIGRKKAAAFAAVPSVLENGRVIDYQTNWKGRGYDTAVVAAPITIQGETYLAGVVLTRSQKENSFYLHEVLLTEKGTTPFKTGGRKSGNPGGDVPSVLSLLRQVQEVKNNRSTDVIMPKLDDGQFSMGRSFSELVQNQRDGVEPGTSGQMGISGFDQGPKVGWTQQDLELERRSAEKRAESQKTQQAAEQTPVERLGGPKVVGDQGDYTNTDFLRGADQGKKATTKARRQAEARLQPTRSEKLFAKGIANGDYTVEDIPASMRRATVTELADYYTAENSYKTVDGVRERGRQIRAQNEQMAAELFKDEGGFKPISMLKMNERTPERVMRNIFGDRQGEIINEKYIYPVQQNEAGKMRFIQRQLDAVRTFEDSQGQRSELTKEERAIVQQIMEDRFVEETVASMEVAQGIRNAAENIRMGKDPVDTAREFSLNAEERGLAQQLARWMQNQEWLESGELDSVKINNAVQKYAEQYDLFYDAVNDFLTAHGYGTIGFIKGYAPHMQGVDTQNKLMSALRSMGVNTDASSLPTSISGLTADYKPGKRWNPFFQSRVGDKTDYDVAKGYESYVSYLGDIFYHTDDIARLRGVSRYLRKTYGPEEINNAIDHAESLRYADLRTQTEVLKDAGKISEGTKLTYQDAKAMMDEYIDELYDNVTKVTKYGEFVKYIDNYANLLAGKQSMADRGMEYMAGRTSLNAGNKLVAAFGRAQVAGNVSSVLNQSSQLAQIAAEVDGKYIAKAAADLAKSTRGKLWNIKETALFDQSDLLTGKKGIEYLTANDSKFDRMVSAMFKPADIMDSMVSALAVQSKYNQLVAEGEPSEVAMLEADRWATQIMASRIKGSRPMAFESKNLVNQMLHMFQVEAMNSWEHLSQDLPYKYRNIEKTHGKKAVTRAVATVVTRGLVSAFLLNRAAEAVYGGTPAPFDVLGYIANFVSSGFGMTTNEGLKQLLNAGWKAMFGEGLLDDDDEKELRPFDWGAAAKDTLSNMSNDVPFLRNGMGLLGIGDQTMPFANMAEAVQGVGKALTAEEKSAGEIGGSLLELGSTLLPGGRQIQKTAQGISTMLQGGRAYGYGDKQRLQYPVEQTPGKWAQAVLFGNSGLSETRDFYASGDSGLTAKQTQVVQEMAKRGINRTEAFNLIQKIRAQKDNVGKLEVITESLLTDQEKLRLCYDVVADKDDTWPDKLKKMMNAGLTWDQAEAAYVEYLNLQDQDSMKASEQATRFAAWIDRSGVSEKQATVVEDTLKFYSQIPAKADRYNKMTDAGLSASKAEDMAMMLGDLRPEVGKDSVSNLQKYEAVVQNKALSEREQMKVLEGIMEDSEYEKLETAYAAGISPAKFLEFKRATDGLSADKVFGKTVSGSKKSKVLAAIDAMDISNVQKTALYYAAGYKESTLDDAPWISGKSVGRSREEALKLLRGANSQPQDLTMPRLTDENGEVWNPFEKKSSDITMPRLVK